MMKFKRNCGKSVVMIGCLAFFLAGCGTSPNKKSINKQELLASAGFKKMTADTDEKLEHLKEMPQRKFFKREKEGNLYYVYADEKTCNCLYYGDKEAFEIYQQILLNKKLDREGAASAAMNRADARYDWGMWGTWSGPLRD